MRVYALYNIKGGVGKTASAINLAYLAAAGGARTLVWDLDPQGAASYYFRVKAKIRGGSEGLVAQKRPLDTHIKGTDYPGLDLLPADFSYRNLDLTLDNRKKPQRQFRRLLKPLASDYDVIFLDCPPSISLVSENIFGAAQVLLIPMIPTTLSLRTYDQIVGFCNEQRLDDLKRMAFFTMVDRRKNLHLEVIESAADSQPEMLETAIPYASDVERMGIHRAPVPEFAPNSRSAMAYADSGARLPRVTRSSPLIPEMFDKRSAPTLRASAPFPRVMLNHQPQSISLAIAHHFDDAPMLLRVLGVHDHACNLGIVEPTSSALIALVTSEQGDGPFHLVLKRPMWHGLSSGQPVRYADRQLQLPAGELDVSDVPRWNPRPVWPEAEQSQAALNFLLEVAAQDGLNGLALMHLLAVLLSSCATISRCAPKAQLRR
ncbi:MAG: ParA family protein [Caldilineaceae bacterium]|nr:ParA family protein [Caldilineaceae bacterium]